MMNDKYIGLLQQNDFQQSEVKINYKKYMKQMIITYVPNAEFVLSVEHERIFHKMTTSNAVDLAANDT